MHAPIDIMAEVSVYFKAYTTASKTMFKTLIIRVNCDVPSKDTYVNTKTLSHI